jgi:gamma-glutamylcyclotransferase (GGCT)/AIG2-like uncharacterized protein YtfP
VTDRPTALFVYGTLMPGHLRWSMLAPHAIDARPATASGWLYDTGQGWPVAHLVDRSDDHVPGWAIVLRPEGLDDLLTALDEMEGVDRGLYERVVVDLADGGTAWAYSMGVVTDTLPRIAAWTDQPEA